MRTWWGLDRARGLVSRSSLVRNRESLVVIQAHQLPCLTPSRPLPFPAAPLPPRKAPRPRRNLHSTKAPGGQQQDRRREPRAPPPPRLRVVGRPGPPAADERSGCIRDRFGWSRGGWVPGAQRRWWATGAWKREYVKETSGAGGVRRRGGKGHVLSRDIETMHGRHDKLLAIRRQGLY